MIEKTGDVVVVIIDGNACTMSTAEFESLARKMGYSKQLTEQLKNFNKIYLNDKRRKNGKKRPKVG